MENQLYYTKCTKIASIFFYEKEKICIFFNKWNY